MTSDKKDIVWRAYLIYFGFVVVMLVVIIKTMSIQFEGGKPYFLSSSDGNERMPTRVVQREPRRGQILDHNYTPLVTSVSFFNIHMDPTVVPDDIFEKEIRNLSVELNKLWPEKSAREYEDLIRSGKRRNSRYIPIHKKATNEERKLLRKMPIFNLGRLKGGLIDNDEIIIRKRPFGELLKRTLGYVQVSETGVLNVGLEGAFNDYLKGEPGEEIEQKISTGWKKIGPIVKDPVEGGNVVTTIDTEIQEVAHLELLNQLKTQNAESGCVIVMDVKTGYIRAIVNLNRGEDGNYYETYNKAIGTKEVPGSTFKLASLMAALEDGKVSIHDKVNAYGTYRFYNSKLVDSHEGGYGTITVQQAFEKSSNVFSKIIHDNYKNDPSAYLNRIKSFGLGDTLGISLKGEPMPTLYEPGMPKWSGLSLPWMAIGYEVQLTPLQILTFYNAVANNGVSVKPQFVSEIRRGNTLIKSFPPIILNDRICSESTLRDVRTCLEGVVKRGTGTALQSAYFDIAGKTGTAVILDNKNTTKTEKKYQASFVGYFPAQNPIYSCIVVVSAPTQNIYGAVVSGTVFTAIANKVYASSLEYHKAINETNKKKEQLPTSANGNKHDLIKVYNAFRLPYVSMSDQEWVQTFTGTKKIEMRKTNMSGNRIPDVTGMTAKDAVYLIERTGMHAFIKGSGKVIKQSVAPGGDAIVGTRIELELR
jgi:cell division protein FtsI (penicillin-binding protein 3)